MRADTQLARGLLQPEAAVTVMDSLPDVVLIVDKQGNIIWANSRLQEKLGYTPASLIGKPVEVLVPAEYRKVHGRLRSNYSVHPEYRPMGYRRQLHAQHQDGSQRPVDISLTPFQFQGQDAVLAVVRDLTGTPLESAEGGTAKSMVALGSQIDPQSVALQIGSWDWNIQTDELSWSEETHAMFLFSRNQPMSGYDTFIGLVHPEDREKVNQAVQRALHEGQIYRVEHRVCLPDGEVKHVLELGRVYRQQDGSPVRMVGTVQDLTREKENQLRLRLLNTMFRHTFEGILNIDQRLHIESANPAVNTITGFSEGQLQGSSLLKLICLNHDSTDLQQALVMAEKEGVWHGTLYCRRRDASVFPVLASLVRVPGAEGDEAYHVLTMTDITELKEQETRLKQLADFDQLTGLYNRRCFFDICERRLASRTGSEDRLAMFYIDLDGFKEINDTQGHLVGDQLLQEISGLLLSAMPEDAVLARLGGDEFALLLPYCQQPELDTLADLLISRLRISKQYPGYRFDISASLGISLCPKHGESTQELLMNADQAMYQAKRRGRDNYQIFDIEESFRQCSRMQLLSRLAVAIDRREFMIYCQPKTQLRRGACLALEALVRWCDQGVSIAPSEFIPVAEESGHILPIGYIVLEKVCQFIAEWRAASRMPVRVAVNLSARQLHDRNLVEKIVRILEKYAVPADTIEFEITESVVMENVAQNQDCLKRLRAMGATIAIDDFGTGYSSLGYLKRLPVDTLKIDRSFIAGITDNEDDLAIVTAIISMAHSLGLTVVAEGVETAAQRLKLCELGCDELQGFLFGQPFPIMDLLQQNSDPARPELSPMPD